MVLLVSIANRVYRLKSLRAAYGYDVNSPEFKAWQAQQQQQYAQYYAQQGYAATGASPTARGSGA